MKLFSFRFYRFEGKLTWDGHTFPLDNEQILYRGAVLRNTRWAYGVVIFAGKDTKLMQNSGKTKLKRTSIDRLLNFIILGVNLKKKYLPSRLFNNVFFLSFFLRLCSFWCACAFSAQSPVESGKRSLANSFR